MYGYYILARPEIKKTILESPLMGHLKSRASTEDLGMVQCNSKPLERSAATFDQDESSRSRMTIKQQWDVSWKEGIEKDKKRKAEHPRSGAGGI